MRLVMALKLRHTCYAGRGAAPTNTAAKVATAQLLGRLFSAAFLFMFGSSQRSDRSSQNARNL